MSDLVIHALRRNREIAKKAGQLERVERYDARLAQLGASPERSTDTDEPELDATDAAIELAEDWGVNLAYVEGTGEGGRILKGDVERAVEAATSGDDEA